MPKGLPCGFWIMKIGPLASEIPCGNELCFWHRQYSTWFELRWACYPPPPPVQLIAWCCYVISLFLNQWQPWLVALFGNTRPQYVMTTHPYLTFIGKLWCVYNEYSKKNYILTMGLRCKYAKPIPLQVYFDGLVQERRRSIANALE